MSPETSIFLTSFTVAENTLLSSPQLDMAAKRWAKFDVPVADKFSNQKIPTFFLFFFATERGRMTIFGLKLREGFAENSFSKLML